jgi:hypothetical protein
MKKPDNTAEIERFVSQWLAQQPALAAPFNLTMEVDRLAALLTAHARSAGITGGEIHRAVGDIDEYLTERFRPAA